MNSLADVPVPESRNIRLKVVLLLFFNFTCHTIAHFTDNRYVAFAISVPVELIEESQIHGSDCRIDEGNFVFRPTNKESAIVETPVRVRSADIGGAQVSDQRNEFGKKKRKKKCLFVQQLGKC